MGAVFDRFLAEEIAGLSAREGDSGLWWGAQHLEGVVSDGAPPLPESLRHRLYADTRAQWWYRRREALFAALRDGDPWLLSALRSRYRFLVVVSPPRTGGTYLTKQLYRGLGVNPRDLPAYFGHDGFPHVPIDGSGREASLMAFAEWLLQAQHFLPAVLDREGKAVVVLKTVKWVWDLGTYVALLGSAGTWIWVDRSPWDVFCSVNDKAGRSRDADQPLRPRIRIDHWLLEHWRLHHADGPEAPILWEAFAGYYEEYRSRLRSLLPARQSVCLPYAAEAIEGFLRDTIASWDGRVPAEPFLVRRYDGG